jgi:hypothetical protein
LSNEDLQTYNVLRWVSNGAVPKDIQTLKNGSLIQSRGLSQGTFFLQPPPGLAHLNLLSNRCIIMTDYC